MLPFRKKEKKGNPESEVQGEERVVSEKDASRKKWGNPKGRRRLPSARQRTENMGASPNKIGGQIPAALRRPRAHLELRSRAASQTGPNMRKCQGEALGQCEMPKTIDSTPQVACARLTIPCQLHLFAHVRASWRQGVAEHTLSACGCHSTPPAL